MSNSRSLKDLGMVKDALPEEVTFKRDPKGESTLTIEREGRVFQAEGTACAKAMRQEGAR